jgi:hypothetical protein
MPPLPDWQVLSCTLELWADYCFTSSFWPDWTLHSHYWYGLLYLEKAIYIIFCLLSINLMLTKNTGILYCYHIFWFIFTCMTSTGESPRNISNIEDSLLGALKLIMLIGTFFLTLLCLYSSINLLTHLISFKNQSIGLLVFFLRIAFSCYQLLELVTLLIWANPRRVAI